MVTQVVTSEAHVSTDQIWAWLADVPDPEIPVISIVDLGIIRSVVWREHLLVVTVTPTYSGCPAASVINFEIEQTLRTHGIVDLKLERQLSPAWTTDWISSAGHDKLRDYGIAPPTKGLVQCPRCGSTQIETISQFGSTPCKALHRCTSCLEPFDRFKCI